MTLITRGEKGSRLTIQEMDNNLLYLESLIGGTGSGSSFIETTYSELLSLTLSEELTPGAFYKITDYRTCYDQPDYGKFDEPIFVGNYKTSDTSPIIVLAISENQLAIDAYQPEYPKDKIKYDISFTQSEVTGGTAYGRITERIDEWNNRTDYDHRTVLFKRYPNYYYKESDLAEGLIQVLLTGEVIGTDTSFTNYAPGDILAIPELEERFFEIVSVDSDTSMFLTGSSISTGSDLSFYLASQDGITYKRNNISTEFTEHPTFLFGDEDIINNYFGDVASLYSWNGYDFLLPNNVFEEDVISNKIGDGFRNNTFESDVEENVIGNGFRNNTICNDEDFVDNQIWNNFANNLIICDNFNDNIIGDGFEDNVFTNGTDFVDNVININFSNNVISGEFEDNNIGNGFEDNKIYSNFEDNKIGNNFENNILGEPDNTSSFEDNNIGNDFKGNLIIGDFLRNKVGKSFQANEIEGNFDDNVIGNYFLINDIGDGFRQNSILNDFYDNDIADYFSYNRIGSNFINNTIDDDFGFGSSVNRGNVIGNLFQNNNVGEYFYDNNIGDNFENNQIGDYFQFNRVETSLDGVDFTEYWGEINFVLFTPTSGVDGIYPGISGTASGNGVNAVFTVGVASGVVNTVEVTNSGNLYKIGDTITIDSSTFGGASDLVLTVTILNAEPMVYGSYNKTIQRDTSGDVILTAIQGGMLYVTPNITEAEVTP